jgi:hypothetical protein
MEHVPPDWRKQVLSEALRVARKIVIFGFPCGPAAFELDQKLYRYYQSRNLRPPVWLEEHMLHEFPGQSLFTDLPTEWNTRVIPNESLRFHYWMMRAEMSRVWDYSFRIMLRIMPSLVEHGLQHADREPSYRMIFVLTREPRKEHD